MPFISSNPHAWMRPYYEALAPREGFSHLARPTSSTYSSKPIMRSTFYVVATHDLPRSAGHPFYARLNQLLDQHNFDGYVEGLCQRSTQAMVVLGCRPDATPAVVIGYFEGLDAERAIAWRAANSFALREFLGLVRPEVPSGHSTNPRTRDTRPERVHGDLEG